jgi:hypothetical protein
MLNPTLDVDVAEPLIVSPLTVVVPNPVFATVNHGFVVEPTHNEKFCPAIEFTERVAAGEEADHHQA